MLQDAVPRTLDGRLRVIGLLLVSALIAFGCLRLALLVPTWSEVPHTTSTVLRVLGVGALYDLGFLVHVGAVLCTLALLPNRVFRFRPVAALAWLGAFAIVYGLLFEVVAEWLFWDEFQARFNFISVDYLIYRREVTDNIRESYPLLPILVGVGAGTALGIALRGRFVWRALRTPVGLRRRFTVWASFAGASALSIACLGQGPRESSSNNFVKELSSNGAYQFVAAFRNNTLDYSEFYAQGEPEELSPLIKADTVLPGEQWLEPDALFSLARNTAPTRPEQRTNVILVCIESLSADFMERFGSTRALTPFLDQLGREGTLFTRCYATGTRTTRGLEAISLSLPPTPGRSIVKRPDCERYDSLGKVLSDNGYDTAFLYGGRGYFDNMNAFFGGNGYRVIDQSDLSAEETTFENAWGVCDEDLYSRALVEADAAFEQARPFFFHVMTTSNHRPYTYPEGKVALASGTGRDGAVQYTDYALSQLVERARSRPWFDDTLFVVVADHCASSAGRVGLPVEKYHIPLLFYGPSLAEPTEVDLLCSQVDLAPTLLAFLGLRYESRFFGRDVLAAGFAERAFIGNYQKLGLLSTDALAILSPQRRIQVMDEPFGEPTIRAGSAAEPIVRRAQAAYQSANYVIEHRLNRW